MADKKKICKKSRKNLTNTIMSWFKKTIPHQRRYIFIKILLWRKPQMIRTLMEACPRRYGIPMMR